MSCGRGFYLIGKEEPLVLLSLSIQDIQEQEKEDAKANIGHIFDALG